jgi:uncharacterized protein
MIEFKTFEAKMLPDDTSNEYYIFEGYVGAFGNVDHHNDILVKGSVSEQVGSTIHFFKDHYREFGAMDIVAEDDYGIKFQARAPKSDNEVVQTANRAKLGAPYQFSIGYRTEKYDIKDGKRYLQKVKLLEGSIVTFGANDKAILTGIKSRHGDESVLDDTELKELQRKSTATLVALNNAIKGVG